MGGYSNTMFQKIKSWIVVAILGSISVLSILIIFL